MRAHRAFGYRRRATPLHTARAALAASYGAAFALAALITVHPILLCALLAAVILAGVCAGVGAELAGTLRASLLPLVVLTVAVNVLVSRGGLTVVARLGDWGPLGQVDLTVEAALTGLLIALRVMVVMLAAVLMMCAADPDELLRALRRVSHRSALTATLATRLIPVLGEDARRLAEAQRCRPDGGAGGARGGLAILRGVVGGALDRALDVAAALEVRGYGGARPADSAAPWSRHDLAFASAAAAIVGLSTAAALSRMAPFSTYPLVHGSLPPLGWALAVALMAVALAPFLARRGIEPVPRSRR